ncbi:MAG: redoxin domain-containing protein, partial [Chloroflexi bacterium]|nr:redoxin domain-containing protein [Chloroflexota bacterium]
GIAPVPIWVRLDSGKPGNIIAVPATSQIVPSSSGVLPPTVTPTPPGNEFAPIGQPESFVIDDLELVGLDGWINTDPLSVTDLVDSGRVVLLDFWTYTCVNCVRTFPYLSAWHETYGNHGLIVIGVHSPEFDFEKIPDNVQSAVRRYGLEYPVALDGDMETWDRYGNHFWPSKYLISATGEVVFRHFGEGGYDETESIIRSELQAAGNDLTGVPHSPVTAPVRSTGSHTITRELYGGYMNNYLSDGLYAGQDNYYEAPDVEVDYADDGSRRHGQFFLDGVWLNTADSVLSANRAPGELARFSFEFFATSVNAVLGHPAGAGDITVQLDGRPLSSAEAGSDVTWEPSGNSVVRVHEARLYQILELPEFGQHELTFTTNTEGLAVYTVTFGVFDSGP